MNIFGSQARGRAISSSLAVSPTDVFQQGSTPGLSRSGFAGLVSTRTCSALIRFAEQRQLLSTAALAISVLSSCCSATRAYGVRSGTWELRWMTPSRFRDKSMSEMLGRADTLWAKSAGLRFIPDGLGRYLPTPACQDR